MATETELKQTAGLMLQILKEQDFDSREALEVALNLYGTVTRLCGVNVHEAVGAVMRYYKSNANH